MIDIKPDIFFQPAWTKANPPKVGDWFILKASYCGKSNTKCTKANPCKECLEMCNRFVIAAEHCGNDFFFDGGWCNRDGGHLLNETYSAVLTFDEKIVNGLNYAHHVSEAQPFIIIKSPWIKEHNKLH